VNSLFVYGIIISLASSLGYKIDRAVDLNTQKAEAISACENFEEKPNLPLPVQFLEFNPMNEPKDTIIYNWELQLSATDWHWRVRKYGVFACQVLSGWIRSDLDVLVDFEGFANLTELDPNSPNGSQIETWYAISQSSPPPKGNDAWITATELNRSDFIIPAPIGGKDWNLWSMIEVTNQTQAGEYQNNPTITFTLQGFKDWIAPEFSLETQDKR